MGVMADLILVLSFLTNNFYFIPKRVYLVILEDKIYPK